MYKRLRDTYFLRLKYKRYYCIIGAFRYQSFLISLSRYTIVSCLLLY